MSSASTIQGSGANSNNGHKFSARERIARTERESTATNAGGLINGSLALASSQWRGRGKRLLLLSRNNYVQPAGNRYVIRVTSCTLEPANRAYCDRTPRHELRNAKRQARLELVLDAERVNRQPAVNCRRCAANPVPHRVVR